MSHTITIEVPDIGDFDNVDIIEILVSPGEQVQQESPLITLETDKATMDIPCPQAGTIEALLVKVGDKVSEGTKLGVLEASGNAAAAASTAGESRAPESAPASAASTASRIAMKRRTSSRNFPFSSAQLMGKPPSW